MIEFCFLYVIHENLFLIRFLLQMTHLPENNQQNEKHNADELFHLNIGSNCYFPEKITTIHSFEPYYHIIKSIFITYTCFAHNIVLYAHTHTS